MRRSESYMAPNDPLPSRPLDPRLHRRRPTDEELERESEITPDDVDEAVSAFDRYAPPDARGLLDAATDED